MRTLEEIANEYKEGEISCLFLYDKVERKAYNLLTIFELVPNEQQASSLTKIQHPSSGKFHYQEIKNCGKRYVINYARYPKQSTSSIAALFKTSQNGFQLKYEDTDINIHNWGQALINEPPSFQPILIPKESNEPISKILPKRNSSFRVWQLFDQKRELFSSLGESLEKVIQCSGFLSQKYLGYSMSEFLEHFGNVYLIASDPVLRFIEMHINKEDLTITVEFLPRLGKTIVGGRIELIEKRAELTGFQYSTRIESNQLKIKVPYWVGDSIFRVFSPFGDCIYEARSGFLSDVLVTGHISDSKLNIEFETQKGTETISTDKFTSMQLVGNLSASISPAYFLRENSVYKRHLELETKLGFIFFPPIAESKGKAESIVAEILNKAKRRCLIVDPYFGSYDFVYIFKIRNDGVPIRIISSASFLGGKSSPEGEEIGEKQAKSLLAVHDNWKLKYPRQTVEIRYFVGREKSPVHDRFIIVDDSVWLLGSSLNEFGSRATTLFKVPGPEILLEPAERWWADVEMTKDLSEFSEEESDEN